MSKKKNNIKLCSSNEKIYVRIYIGEKIYEIEAENLYSENNLEEKYILDFNWSIKKLDDE